MTINIDSKIYTFCLSSHYNAKILGHLVSLGQRTFGRLVILLIINREVLHLKFIYTLKIKFIV